MFSNAQQQAIKTPRQQQQSTTTLLERMETAMKMITKALVSVRIETANNVIDKFTSFLSEKMDVDEDVKGWFEEFRQKMTQELEADAPALPRGSTKKSAPQADKPAKKPKKLAAVNLFIQDHMAKLKAENASKDGESYFKQATVAWNQLTPAEKEDYKQVNKDRLDAVNEERLANPDARKKGAKKTPVADIPVETSVVKKITKEEKPEKKTEKKTKKTTESAIDLPQATRFLEMLEAAKVAATEIKKAKGVLATLCEEIKKEMDGETVENAVFAERLAPALEKKKVIFGNTKGEKVLVEFEEEMLKVTNVDADADEADDHESTGSNDEDESAVAADEDDVYY